ncbi:uncharacterized protein IL334_001709 [Kwoniella shivajii]|uniref:Uncharacterized protein n=1 Tax=Kwoniella shivajii TaxID=564305 RepID=A0ABZ1CU95_9TREE|nr:hypothetical protein IL334_001709 [Kwoniella shivajii]
MSDLSGKPNTPTHLPKCTILSGDVDHFALHEGVYYIVTVGTEGWKRVEEMIKKDIKDPNIKMAIVANSDDSYSRESTAVDYIEPEAESGAQIQDRPQPKGV